MSMTYLFSRFKGTAHAQIKDTYFILFPVVPFIHLHCWLDLLTVRDIDHGAVGSSLEYNGTGATCLVVLKVPKRYSIAKSLSRNNDHVTQDTHLTN